ncbi:hypothetical protein BT69DRAFT_1335143 [Atractiella rhizophila]|nr:hypothetical protein BT69DRAFT_1335143 [Atractiella rhizophila]
MSSFLPRRSTTSPTRPPTALKRQSSLPMSCASTFLVETTVVVLAAAVTTLIVRTSSLLPSLVELYPSGAKTTRLIKVQAFGLSHPSALNTALLLRLLNLAWKFRSLLPVDEVTANDGSELPATKTMWTSRASPVLLSRILRVSRRVYTRTDCPG